VLNHPANRMMNAISDRALLERALLAIEQVLAKGGASMGSGVPAGTAAYEAATMCLTCAIALVDVAQALLREPEDQSREVLSTEWQAIIAHTKNASRTAHQAALVLSAQRNLVAAQGGVSVSGGGEI
jgi:hypothetical protein